MNILSELKDRFRPGLAEFADDPQALADLLAMIRPAQDPRFGDYQANFAMPLGKRLGKPPREIAARIVETVRVDDLCRPPEIAGPGFINLRLLDEWLVDQLQQARDDDRLGVAPVAQPRTYVVDFSSPNVAKPMHVGHIRSTVIGDALCHLLRFSGHRVISDNHLGDWGTQFGMIIYGYRHFVDEADYAEQPIDELCRVYRVVRETMDVLDSRDQLPRLEQQVEQQREQLERLRGEDPGDDKSAAKKHRKAVRKAEADLKESERALDAERERLALAEQNSVLRRRIEQHGDIRTRVLEETARLHEGDSENRRLWQDFLPKCQADIQRIYDRLDVTFDHELGESFYHDRLAGVVSSLQENGLATESEGAMCVFLDEHETPMIVRKRDGAFLYATTDLATIQYRMETWQPDAILYIVDFRQGEHFDKLFAVARRWGLHDVELEHIRFGTVLGDDGRPFKTRSGDTVGLDGLLDEAERRAYKVVREGDESKPTGAAMDEPRRRSVARVVGIAALKYADLAQNRESDYVFSYDKMLALNGNTATYLQYSYARVHGIFERGQIDVAQLRQSGVAITLDEAAERALALRLLQFAEAISETVADYRPNLLTNYLYELAKIFTTFFEKCPVLKAETPALRDSRLMLCDLTARTMKLGLSLLGIQVVEKM